MKKIPLLICMFMSLSKKMKDCFLVSLIQMRERSFSELLTVQGVGGKMAINIMSYLEIKDIINSITSENTKTFSMVSGVGNKLATRIVNELKEKFKKRT